MRFIHTDFVLSVYFDQYIVEIAKSFILNRRGSASRLGKRVSASSMACSTERRLFEIIKYFARGFSVYFHKANQILYDPIDYIIHSYAIPTHRFRVIIIFLFMICR